MLNFFAAVPRGLEYALSLELKELGGDEIRETVAGVYFCAPLEIGYRITLWSRLASRIILLIYQGSCESSEQLYDASYSIDWPDHFSSDSCFSVDFHGVGGFINNSQYGALKVKDAVVDRFRKDGLERPNVSRVRPDFKIDAHYKRGQLILGINFSGPALHQRGYRTSAGVAPLKENLAANMLIRSGWSQDQQPLLDPFCGSGTLLIEAALMASDIAPALKRDYFGFEHWKQHQDTLWQEIVKEAKVRAELGVQRCPIKFFGSDIDERMIATARQNAQNAGVGELIEFNFDDALTLTPPIEQGYLITNPPYGERLGTMTTLIQLYYQFGNKCKRDFSGWKVAVLSGDIKLLSAMKLKADKQMKMYNGAIECGFNLYQVHAINTRRIEPNSTSTTTNAPSAAPSDVAVALVNRIKKNAKQLARWAQRENIDSYRLYDADIPEYNVAIDKYTDYVVVQEYLAAKEIPESVTKRRLTDILLVLPSAIDIDPDKIIVKTRQRQKGDKQYQKLNTRRLELNTVEYGAKFKVNLTDYLDTGLFLDHRLMRKLVGDKAKDKDVLNLFAYTGAASVHAALGGAKSVTTVDMSKTYTSWAQDNFVLNNLRGRQYQFIQSDCFKWIAACQHQYDLIFVDPPTFSNSKRMEDSFDVQRDHVNLLTAVTKLLHPDGEIIFSNNKRKFNMDIESLKDAGLQVKNIDKQTLPPDYKRNPRIHNSWLITHA